MMTKPIASNSEKKLVVYAPAVYPEILEAYRSAARAEVDSLETLTHVSG